MKPTEAFATLIRVIFHFSREKNCETAFKNYELKNVMIYYELKLTF